MFINKLMLFWGFRLPKSGWTNYNYVQIFFYLIYRKLYLVAMVKQFYKELI